VSINFCFYSKLYEFAEVYEKFDFQVKDANDDCVHTQCKNSANKCCYCVFSKEIKPHWSPKSVALLKKFFYCS